VLREIGLYLDMQGVAFKPRAYEKAAEAVASLTEEAGDIYSRGGLRALEEIPGVGASIAEKIEELLTTGTCAEHVALRKKTPVNLSELSRVEGLGPKKIKTLYQKLRVKDLADLEAAAKKGAIAKLEGFGKKSEENIKKSLEFAKHAGDRVMLGLAMPEIRMYEARLRKLPAVARLVVAGSVRRRKETIGDVDLLAVSKKPQQVMDAFVAMPEVVSVHAKGETKSAVKVVSGLNIDLRVVPESSYGAALNYFTGSKDHNVALRQIAMNKGLKLNEYGLWKGKKQVAGKTEEELYKALGMHYIEPELREHTGEIKAALRPIQDIQGRPEEFEGRQAQGKRPGLPTLIGYKDLRGDLQVQTDWTDGKGSIEAMARAAREAGLEYIAITDHSKRLAMTHGLDEKRIIQQMAEIARVNKRLQGSGLRFRVLSGSECDILKDGALDLPDNILAKLDVVGASVHSYFNLPKAEQTKRIMRAMDNPHVDIIFHPTGRIIGKRPPYEVDIPALITHAKNTGTILEIDALPDRLDLKDDYIRMAIKGGVKLAIDSDAHAPSHFSVLEYGIAQARRGWAEKKDIINAWPLEKMKGFLKK